MILFHLLSFHPIGTTTYLPCIAINAFASSGNSNLNLSNRATIYTVGRQEIQHLLHSHLCLYTQNCHLLKTDLNLLGTRQKREKEDHHIGRINNAFGYQNIVENSARCIYKYHLHMPKATNESIHRISTNLVSTGG